MNLALVTAFGHEHQTLVELLESKEVHKTEGVAGSLTITHGLIQNVNVHLFVAGVGQENISGNLSAYFKSTKNLGALMLGFCGGLSQNARVGSISIPDRCILRGGESWSPSHATRQRVAKNFYDHEVEFLVGDMLTVDEIVKTSEQRRALNSETSAVSVDMESAFFSQTCENFDIPWFVLKVVMDDLYTQDMNFNQLKPSLEKAKVILQQTLPLLLTSLKEEWSL